MFNSLVGMSSHDPIVIIDNIIIASDILRQCFPPRSAFPGLIGHAAKDHGCKTRLPRVRNQDCETHDGNDLQRRQLILLQK